MLRLPLAHEPFDQVVFHQEDVLHPMAGDKAVLADHHRKHHVLVLRNRVGLKEIVIGFLVGLRIDLNPPAVPGSHAVGMIRVDVDGAGQGPVHQRQHHRQPVGSRHVQLLPHQGQAAGGSGRKRPCPRCGSPHGGAHGTVLALHWDELRVDFPVGDIVCHILRNLRGGRDGECRHHVRIDLFDGICHGFIAG